MDTRDWAEEAHDWFESYHESILQQQQQQQQEPNHDVVSTRFFGNLTINDTLWKRFISHPVLMGGKKSSNNHNFDIDNDYATTFLLNWKTHDYDLLEQDRGWQPLLRSLPKVEHYRLLTLIRRNLLQPLDHHDDDDASLNHNHALVSRHQWVLLEGLRWKAGLYQRPDVLKIIQQHYNNKLSLSSENEDSLTSTFTKCHSSYLEVVQCTTPSPPPPQPQLLLPPAGKVNNNNNINNGGRCVIWKGETPTMPGDLLCQAKPLCIALYNVNVPDNNGTACFHCGRQPHWSSSSSSSSNNAIAMNNAVRDLTFLCQKCQIWSYCCFTCRQESEWLHQRECVHLPKLLDHCYHHQHAGEEEESITVIPSYKALLVLRAALQKYNPKPEIQQQWKQLMELETHWQEHHEQQQSKKSMSYLQQAYELSQWMLDNGLLEESGDDNMVTITLHELVHIFLAINVNAIGLGDNNAAVGLFPGLPSMLNHSCNENVTHSWHGGNLGMVLQFRAVETISFGQECCISYVSQLQESTQERTACLTKYKFFTCRCLRCQSKDEQGRLNATIEWKECMDALQKEETNNDSIKLYRKLVDLSSILFPTNFVTKGWVMEECAHALLQQQDSHCHHDESIQLLQMAREQYGTCRGFDSPLVERVNQALHSLTTTTTTTTTNLSASQEQEQEQQQQDENNDNNDDENNTELCLNNGGWSNSVLLEIKTYEAPEHVEDWGLLAKRIKEYWSDVNVVQWSSGIAPEEDTMTTTTATASLSASASAAAVSAADETTYNDSEETSNSGYRLLNLAYGIQSLVLSCRIDQSIKTREQVAQETEEFFDDIIQHVDLIVASDYIY